MTHKPDVLSDRWESQVGDADEAQSEAAVLRAATEVKTSGTLFVL